MARPGIQKHLDIAHLLRCPLCGGALQAREASLACDNRHDFTISAKGFANLIPQQAPLKGYDEAFFTSRQRVMKAGFYRDLNRALTETLASLELPARPVIVDAGCGEGSHLKSLGDAFSRPVCSTFPAQALKAGGSGPISEKACERPEATLIGIDIVKEAVRCAARGGGPERWLVADLANMPLQDHCADVILNVFTPANYAEFSRVLTLNGTLIKVVPAKNHMRELRELAGQRLSHVEAQDHGVAEHLSRHMKVISRSRVTQTSPVTPELAEDLARMSPVTFGLDAAELKLEKLDQITVDAEIICAKKAN
ncbi:MAG: methyltransferase domain-containing protein [Coriobacteriaceae bacterium]|nr:methyltransferase domain-containing protein [Coriobacteriaceae bacterium]